MLIHLEIDKSDATYYLEAYTMADPRGGGGVQGEYRGQTLPHRSHPVYGSCGSRNSREPVHRVAFFSVDSDWQCWSYSTLESIAEKRSFRCHFLNIGPSYKRKARKSCVYAP